MTSPTALPIARLRAAWCRVSTIVGHSPEIGDYLYVVRVPDAFGDVRDTVLADAPVVVGNARARIHQISDGHHVTAMACSYVPRQPIPDRATRLQNRADVAEVLTRLADWIER